MGKGCELRGTCFNLAVLLLHLFASGSSNNNTKNHCSVSSSFLFTSAFDQHPKLLVPGVYDTRGAPREWWLESCSLRRVPPVAGLNDTEIIIPVSSETDRSKRLRARVDVTRAWCCPEHTAAITIDSNKAAGYRSYIGTRGFYSSNYSPSSNFFSLQTPKSSSKTATAKGVSILHKHQRCCMERNISEHRENSTNLEVYRGVSRHSHHDSINSLQTRNHNPARLCKFLFLSSNICRQTLRGSSRTSLKISQQQNHGATIRHFARKDHGAWSQQLFQSLCFRLCLHAPKLLHSRRHCAKPQHTHRVKCSSTTTHETKNKRMRERQHSQKNRFTNLPVKTKAEHRH